MDANIIYTEAVSENLTSVNENYNSTNNVHGRHNFVINNPSYAIPCLILLGLATVIGTFGNIMILILIQTRKILHNVETTFIVNLAISDLYVTMVADPMSFIAKIEGEHFFNKVPGLCQAIASICTISCVTSLMTIAVMSLNRYFYICNHEMYERLFTRWNCICICVCLYLVGGTLVLLNALGIGDHSFDRKSLECIWDRMATFYYTVLFSITLVWIPSIITGACYLRIYLYVRKHRRRIQEQTHTTSSSSSLKSSQLAKTLFIIYAVFITCWAPYALLIVIDSDDTYPHELHVYITMFAHLHPSLNWLIYYITNKQFAEAYIQVLKSCVACRAETTITSNALTHVGHQSPQKHTRTDTSKGKGVQPNLNFPAKTKSPTMQTKLTISNKQSQTNGHAHLDVDETGV